MGGGVYSVEKPTPGMTHVPGKKEQDGTRDLIMLLKTVHNWSSPNGFFLEFLILYFQTAVDCNSNRRKRNHGYLGTPVVKTFFSVRRGDEDKEEVKEAMSRSYMRTPRLQHILCSERALCFGY